MVRLFDDYVSSQALPAPITVKNSMNMGANGTMQIVLSSNDDWNSTICFAAGIPVRWAALWNWTSIIWTMVMRHIL